MTQKNSLVGIIHHLNGGPDLPDENYLTTATSGMLKYAATQKGDPERVLDAIKTSKRLGLDLLVGPEFALVAQENFPYASVEARDLLNALREETEGSQTLVLPGTMVVYTKSGYLYNVMPVLQNGRIRHVCFKSSDGGSSDFRPRGERVFPVEHFQDVLRTSRNGLFSSGEVRIGVEICSDWGYLYDQGVTGLDVQVHSCMGGDQTYSVLRKGGYLVYADEYSKRHFVRRPVQAFPPGKFSLDESWSYDEVKPSQEPNENLTVYELPERLSF
jgi:hypothetical protein